MKKLALSLIPFALLVMADCASYKAPALVAPVRAAVAKAQTANASAQGHVKTLSVAAAELEAKLPPQTPELHDLAAKIRTEAEAADKDLTTTASALRDAQIKTSDLEGTVGKMANELAIVNRRYDKLKFGLCTLAAAGALYLLLQFRTALMMLGGWGMAAIIAGPALIFALCWKLIDWVL